jgi:hypothetical protein
MERPLAVIGAELAGLLDGPEAERAGIGRQNADIALIDQVEPVGRRAYGKRVQDGVTRAIRGLSGT